MRRQRRRCGLIAGLAVLVIAVAAEGTAAAQTRIRAPYLDIVWDYYDGNHQQAIAAIAAWPVDGLRERVFGDLDTAVAAALGGSTMRMTEAQRFSAVKIWAMLTPVAALLHVEAGYQLLQKGQDKPGVQHLLLARSMADWTRWRFILEYLPDESRKLALSGGAPSDAAARFLWDVVHESGGVFMNAEATNQLERRFTEALDHFRQRYVLTYVPRGVERKGWHPVTIAIKDRRYRIRARPGYFVP